MSRPMNNGDTINNDTFIWWRPGRLQVPGRIMDVAAGTGSVANFNSSGIFGFNLATNADGCGFGFPVPADLDPGKLIRVRLLLASGTGSSTITPTVTYRAIIPGTTTLILPATALTLTVGAQTLSSTANSPTWSSYGTLAPDTLTETVEYLAWEIVRTAASVATSVIAFEMVYSPRRLYYGDGMSREAKLPQATLAKTYA